MIGVQTVPAEQLPLVGAMAGEKLEGRVYRCREFIEKPQTPQEFARLKTPGIPEGQYLAHCGIYIFSPEIFDCLSWLAAGDRPAGQELPLSDAQAILPSATRTTTAFATSMAEHTTSACRQTTRPHWTPCGRCESKSFATKHTEITEPTAYWLIGQLVGEA